MHDINDVTSKIRNVEIEDLLGRAPITVSDENVFNYVKDKVILVTGGGGTILQPAINLLEKSKDFPSNGPILIITDGFIENKLNNPE